MAASPWLDRQGAARPGREVSRSRAALRWVGAPGSPRWVGAPGSSRWSSLCVSPAQAQEACAARPRGPRRTKGSVLGFEGLALPGPRRAAMLRQVSGPKPLSEHLLRLT